MKYVITGATSFLGVELTRYILSRGGEVIAVCRKGSPGLPKLGVHPNLKVVLSELSEYVSLSANISHADVFINLAWEGTGHDRRDLVQVQKDNIVHSLQSIKVASVIGCSLFVEAGSQAEYGTVLDKITETTPCNPFSEYGKAKLAVKNQGSELANNLGMKYLHLRIFSLFGENDHPWTLVMSSLNKFLCNEPVDLSPCTQNWNFLYVKDAAMKIILLCQYALNNKSFHSEIYNLASRDTRILRSFVQEMYELSQSESILNYGSVKPANIVSLDPDTSKTEDAIGIIKECSFKEVVERIIYQMKQNEQ